MVVARFPLCRCTGNYLNFVHKERLSRTLLCVSGNHGKATRRVPVAAIEGRGPPVSLTMAIMLIVLVVAAAGVALAACKGWRAAGTGAGGGGVPDEMGLRDVLDAAPQPMLVIHPLSGRVFLANAAARALFAGKGGTLDTVVPEELHADPAQRATFLSRLAGHGVVDDFPTRLVGRGGQPLDMRLSARRLRFAGEDALCVVLHDVTAQAAAEARHRALLGQIDAGVVLLDDEVRVTYANPAAGRLLGRPTESLPGRAWSTLVGPDGARPAIDALRNGAFSVARVGLAGALHGPLAETWLTISAGPLGGGGGGGDGGGGDRVVCSLVDITDLKAAESALADSSDALRAVFDAAPLPILVLRRRGGDVLLANRPAQEAFTPVAAADGHWLDAYMDRQERRALLAALVRRGVLHGHEAAVRLDGRTPRWMRLAANRLDYFGVEAVMIAFSDAAESRRLSRALAAAEADRGRVEEDLRQVASALDVDVAGPVRVAESALEGLRQRLDPHAPADVAALLARGLSAQRTAEQRLAALAAYARIALHDQCPAMVDLADVVQDVRRALSMPMAREDAVLQVESLLPVLRADRAALAWALGHLVDNALRFRHPCRRPLIRLSARREVSARGGDVWHLRVEDNGRGIPQRHCDRAFGLFQRMHPDAAVPAAEPGGDRGAGAGAGLAICRRIIADHGGSIRLESAEGAGTTAHIILPATQADILPLPGTAGAGTAGAGTAGPGTAGPGTAGTGMAGTGMAGTAG